MQSKMLTIYFFLFPFLQMVSLLLMDFFLLFIFISYLSYLPLFKSRSFKHHLEILIQYNVSSLSYVFIFYYLKKKTNKDFEIFKSSLYFKGLKKKKKKTFLTEYELSTSKWLEEM